MHLEHQEIIPANSIIHCFFLFGAAPGGVAYRMPGTGWSGNSGGGSPGGMVMPGLPGGPASSPNSGSTGYYGGGSMPSIPAMVTTTPYVNSGTALSSSATGEHIFFIGPRISFLIGESHILFLNCTWNPTGSK